MKALFIYFRHWKAKEINSRRVVPSQHHLAGMKVQNQFCLPPQSVSKNKEGKNSVCVWKVSFPKGLPSSLVICRYYTLRSGWCCWDDCCLKISPRSDHSISCARFCYFVYTYTHYKYTYISHRVTFFLFSNDTVGIGNYARLGTWWCWPYDVVLWRHTFFMKIRPHHHRRHRFISV